MKSKGIFKRSIEIWRHFRYGGMRSVRSLLQEEDSNHVHILSRQPPVVLTFLGRDDLFLHESFRNRSLVLLYGVPYTVSEERASQIGSKVLSTLKEFKKHRIVILCNEESTVGMFTDQGVEAIFCNHNALVDENTFQIHPEIQKTHDSIYNAALAPYKRWELASELKSLLVLAYSVSWMNADPYANEIRKNLADATWIVDATQDTQKLRPADLPAIYNRAHVGLCLSASEGAMLASIEYLLCGLPVVSTPSTGGRDVFWDEDFVILCDPTPDSVKRSVEEMKGRNIDPELIRRKTLTRMEEHRERLRNYLSPVIRDFECPWPPGGHGITTFRSWKSVIREIQQES